MTPMTPTIKLTQYPPAHTMINLPMPCPALEFILHHMDWSVAVKEETDTPCSAASAALELLPYDVICDLSELLCVVVYDHQTPPVLWPALYCKDMRMLSNCKFWQEMLQHIGPPSTDNGSICWQDPNQFTYLFGKDFGIGSRHCFYESFNDVVYGNGRSDDHTRSKELYLVIMNILELHLHRHVKEEADNTIANTSVEDNDEATPGSRFSASSVNMRLQLQRDDTCISRSHEHEEQVGLLQLNTALEKHVLELHRHVKEEADNTIANTSVEDNDEATPGSRFIASSVNMRLQLQRDDTCISRSHEHEEQVGLLQLNTESEIASVLEHLTQLPTDLEHPNICLIKSEHNAYRLSDNGIQSLGAGEWLNDEVINGFFEVTLKPILKDRQVMFSSSMFMSKLLNGRNDSIGNPRYNYKEVKQWDKRNSILNFKQIYVPINAGGYHWILLCADLVRKSIELYDPRGVMKSNQLYLKTMYRFLKDKHMEAGAPHGENWLVGWTLADNSHCSPIQSDGYNCGLFLIANATILSQGLPLVQTSYLQKDFHAFQTRQRVALLLVCRCISGPKDVVRKVINLIQSGGQDVYASLHICTQSDDEDGDELSKSEVDRKEEAEVIKAECNDLAVEGPSARTRNAANRTTSQKVNAKNRRKNNISKTPNRPNTRSQSARRQGRANRKKKKKMPKLKLNKLPEKKKDAEFIDFTAGIRHYNSNDDPLSQQLPCFDNDDNKTLLSFVIDNVPNALVCPVCGELAACPRKLQCCNTIICYQCAREAGNMCPLKECQKSIGEMEYCPQCRSIDSSIDALSIHCTNGCGWYGSIKASLAHTKDYCYCFDKSVDLLPFGNSMDGCVVVQYSRRELNDSIKEMAERVRELQLKEHFDYVKRRATSRFREQMHVLRKRTMLLESVVTHVETVDAQAQKEREAANCIIQKDARMLEELSNSVTTKTSGGGNHQTFDHDSWSKIHDTTIMYATALFGDTLVEWHCVDIGGGILIAVISGSIASSKMIWTGVEICANRLRLGAEICKLFDTKWRNESSSTRKLNVGFIQADCCQPLNLRG